MGPQSHGVTAPETAEQEVSRLRSEIDEVRGRLGRDIGELDRRRHELFDWRLQLRRHQGLAAAVGAGVVLVLGSAVAWGTWRERRRSDPREKLRRVRDAVGRIVERPEAVAPARRRSMAASFVGAAGATLASVLARRLIAQALPARK